MEPEGSSPYSQVPATCPYPEPTPSSPHNSLPLPEDPSSYYPPICVWVSPMVSFLQVSPPEPCALLSPGTNELPEYYYLQATCASHTVGTPAIDEGKLKSFASSFAYNKCIGITFLVR